jgi:DNA-binding MarR family transcriptional regulator
MNQSERSDWNHPIPPQHLGTLLHRLADDFQQRTLSKCRQRGHRKFRASHSPLIHHLDTTGASLGDLANRIGMSQQAAGKMVRDLERAGYVKRELDINDKRSRIIRLSESGATLQRDIADVLQEVSGEYRAVLGSEPMDIFERQLHQALAALNVNY